MHLEGWIREGPAVRNMVTLEGGRVGRATAANEDQLGAGRLDLSKSSAQLRGALSAMGSTEVTDEAKQDRALASQPAQLDRTAFRVKSDQRAGEPWHCCILRRSPDGEIDQTVDAGRTRSSYFRSHARVTCGRIPVGALDPRLRTIR